MPKYRSMGPGPVYFFTRPTGLSADQPLLSPSSLTMGSTVRFPERGESCFSLLWFAPVSDSLRFTIDSSQCLELQPSYCCRPYVRQRGESRELTANGCRVWGFAPKKEIRRSRTASEFVFQTRGPSGIVEQCFNSPRNRNREMLPVDFDPLPCLTFSIALSGGAN